MISDNNGADPNNKEVANNDSAKKTDDMLGENAGDSALDEASQANVQDKPDDTRVKTVTPGNGNDDPAPESGQPATNKAADTDSPSSNKGQGPSGENL